MPEKIAKIAAFLALGFACCGCTDQAGSGARTKSEKEQAKSEEQHEQLSFREAVEKLIKMNDQIREGFAADDIDSAHGPLHEVGHVLEDIAALAEQEELPEVDLSDVKAAKEKLFVAFGNIDNTLHGGEGSTYEEEAEEIQSSLTVIVKAAGLNSE